jgi:diguanylate cyclase (GGDEF)-like protein
VYVDEEPAKAIADVRSACFSRYKLNGPDADALLADIGTRTKEVASLFEINIGSSLQYDAILKKANEALVEITLQSQIEATQLQAQNKELKQQAITDGLTGLANRARFDQFIADAFTDAVKNTQPLAVLMIDVDKFKKINDTCGHPAGDAVLRVLGKLLKTVARERDLAARYGGEELVLVLPDTSRTKAATIAETIRRAICAKPITHDGKAIPVSASIGVSIFEPGGPFTTSSYLLKAADLALYNAKHSGRNCVRVFALKPTQPAGNAPSPTPIPPAPAKPISDAA